MAMTTKNFGKQGQEDKAKEKEKDKAKEPKRNLGPGQSPEGPTGAGVVLSAEGDADISGEGAKPPTQSPSWAPQPKGPSSIATFTGAEKNPNNAGVANKDL
jgi:hypothetical protein